MPWQHHDNIYMGSHNIRQLLDPILPQDAATKQYADQVANEVVIQREEPRDVRAELWVDWDEPGGTALEQEVYVTLLEPAPPWELWCAIGDAVPIVGGTPVPVNEVSVQPTQPAEVTTELWLDTAAPDPAQSAIITELMAEVARMRVELDALKEAQHGVTR